ncbi:Na+/H+ antiporter subunit D [Salisediminibacterium halotolerans]|uniref:Multicomponent Na+:H+ antiporter subunit D n=1 Tax=Salisediminibacterium halotolerans TaxID=517425 RepID=A0A1H9S3I7_9BACI|nr:MULTISPECIES: Na+/H+ antiporter subunit D [Salisediminibacterium]RLJ78189.1 multisubunit sodium/proton antiporter MrpD subunit [Actinophytocola xinjiangensis]RPE88472.1 multisubunit sodium/proton antiporter MrpD subunit [Salisediminibacterium halotolerans]TWG37166.1 multisubunit sodium/proton antiporter MrpD subunit [Salisediminibacterium halotolerans]SER79560.1 multicomponent Na+:H+ antiporter subunit D [Salisediminibacterium haloalkalitolerans]GEL08644.1 Na(+)/H(+) antiporter subunit D [S
MTNLLILPILIPLLAGVILIFFKNSKMIQRVISVIASAAMTGISGYLIYAVYNNGIQTIALGDWQAPFGIVLVADLLSVSLVFLAGILGLVTLFFAYQTFSAEREANYFHTFYLFLMVGVNGSFMTGDLFNLFVFFEVMLISSFILISMGSQRYQLQESLKYVIINTVSSMFFIAAIAYIYGVTGTLNMADLSVKIAQLYEQENSGILTVIALTFLFVFGTKSAIFPLYFWLPHSYFAPPAAIAALFGGLLTKVGVYTVMRMYTLIFNNDPIVFQILLLFGGLTMFIGVLGAVAQFDFKRILSVHIVSQVGYMIMGIGIGTPLAIAGTFYFLAHNIIVKSGLFFFAGITEKITGTTHLKKMSGLLKTHPYVGWLFFITAISLAGLPPLSGFFGKFALVIAGFEAGHYFVIAVSLATGVLTLFSMMKIFMTSFWGEEKLPDPSAKERKVGKLILPVLPLVALTVILGVAAEPFFLFSLEMGEQLTDPSYYVESVLEE